MSNQTIVFLLSGIIFILALINGILIWYFYKTNKRINSLLEEGKIKSFKDIFLRQKEKSDKIEQDLKEAFLMIDQIRSASEKAIQKTGVVRFNPFNEMGGNQSFTIALLDDKNNGFVISSLFVKEGNRVYAKPVQQGKSSYLLSKEEEEAIARAIGA